MRSCAGFDERMGGTSEEGGSRKDKDRGEAEDLDLSEVGSEDIESLQQQPGGAGGVGGRGTMWTVWIRPAEFKLLLEGKTVEKLLDNGLVSLQAVEANPDEGGTPSLKITYLTEDEAGLRLTR